MSFASRIATVIAIFAVFVAAGTARADGNAARGKDLAYTCLGCHAIDNYKNVYPTYSVPKLHGQNAAYLVALVRAGANVLSNAPTNPQAVTLTPHDTLIHRP